MRGEVAACSMVAPHLAVLQPPAELLSPPRPLRSTVPAPLATSQGPVVQQAASCSARQQRPHYDDDDDAEEQHPQGAVVAPNGNASMATAAPAAASSSSESGEDVELHGGASTSRRGSHALAAARSGGGDAVPEGSLAQGPKAQEAREEEEPLLRCNPNRYTMFPIQCVVRTAARAGEGGTHRCAGPCEASVVCRCVLLAQVSRPVQAVQAGGGVLLDGGGGGPRGRHEGLGAPHRWVRWALGG